MKLGVLLSQVRIEEKNILARARHAVFDQNFSGELIEIGWALRRYRLGAVAYEQHRCAKFS